MAWVVEAFLSASVQKLVDSITSNLKSFFWSKEDDPSLLNKLKTILVTFRAVLDDAEEKQIRNQAVKEWVHDLKDALYDADNLLDEVNTRASARKIEADSHTFGDQVQDFFSSPLKRLRGGTNSELEELLQKLEYFAKQMRILGLKEGVSGTGSIWQSSPTTSVVRQSTVYGRDDDIKKLKQYLLSNDACDDHTGVITIVGMGGLGKTMLAQLLCRDQDVERHFTLKAWANITKEFDVFRVTKTLLESVIKTPVATKNLDALQVELQQSLSGKKILFVLDDLWDTYDDWNRLKTILKCGNAGSRVIVTTRQANVALAMNTFPVHYLSPLSREQCWNLLAEHAFGSNQCIKDQKLELIGRKIADKCGGLPLAAEALGGLLRTKLSEKDWNTILKSNIWDLPNNKVLPPLLLSYHYLPAPLKACFAYCSIFPKNYVLEKEMVVRLWMAEGLVHQFKNKNCIEEIADEYFDELVSRSLIQRDSVFFGKDMFKMHDLINDLATSVSAGYCFRYEDPNPSECLDRVRHLSYKKGTYDYHGKFDVISRINGLRTFLALDSMTSAGNYLAKSVLQEIMVKMRYLRVLSLSHYNNIGELPDLVLPRDMDKLINLRHIDLSGTKLKEMPPNVSRLKNLKTLTSFVVGEREDGLKVKELGKFSQLRGKLSILNLQHVDDANDASQANLKNKEQIEELAFEWGENTKDSGVEREVLEQLQPSTNLKILSIKFYDGINFPNWLGYSSFSNMASISIKCSSSFQPFPCLQRLSFFDLPNWEEWLSVKDVATEFPSLETLIMVDCPKLRGNLPNNLPSLKAFYANTCDVLELQNSDEVDSINIHIPPRRASHLKWISSLRSLEVNQSAGVLSLLETDTLPLLEHFNVGNHDSLQLAINSNRLQTLCIHSMSSLVSFHKEGLPSSLKNLDISNLEKLEFLPVELLHKYSSLVNLSLCDSCHSLESFPLDCFPVLKDLSIRKAPNLKTFAISQGLSHLNYLVVENCPSLDSFPQSLLLCINLKEFYVRKCEKLKSMPKRINTMTGLQRLVVDDLPCLESFAEEGLPLNLQKLEVVDCGKLSTISITQWGSQCLTSLTALTIGGDDVVDTLMQKVLLPTSLVSLSVKHVSYLDGKGLQHLTSLENLEIVNCPTLQLLPEKELLSLSLLVLTIIGCPLLQDTYRSNGGMRWPKIAHIPCIKINDEVII